MPSIPALVALGALSALATLVAGPTSAVAAAPDAQGFTPGHPGVRVLVARGCPVSVSGDRDVTNPMGPARPLVAPGPRAALICRYGPVPVVPASQGAPGESSAGLYRSSRLGVRQAVRLAAVIDAITITHPTALASCPVDLGSATIIAFSYRHRPDVDLWYHDGGCETLDNGRSAVVELGNPSFSEHFVALLDALAPGPVAPGSSTTPS